MLCLSRLLIAVIDANTATANQKLRTTTFSGAVIISQGSIKVHADTATASEDLQNNKTIVLIGRPVTFSQVDNDGSMIRGQCDQFTYMSGSGMALMYGRAILRHSNDLVSGHTISYNLKTGAYSVIGDSASGVANASKTRVRVILDKIHFEQPGVSN
jgi:lipopolysaccharide export system protein LptA